MLTRQLSRPLAQCLLHDLFFNKRGITVPVKHLLHRTIVKHKARLNAELQKLKIQRKVTKDIELSATNGQDRDRIPRYVRVNTLKMTREVAEQALIASGFKMGDITMPKSFTRDEHLQDLFAFHPRTDFHANELYLDGSLILQDKASCFPATVLAPAPGSVCIDACAAPGNKTSHLSAILQNTGKIYAFDLDKRRLETLKKLTTKAGCQNITPIHASFLDADPMDSVYASVEYILLDPSCSGSGIVSRLDHLIDVEERIPDENTERLDSLAEFQLSVIQHAFKFPAVKKIVYSTCSIHVQENETVVAKALQQANGIFQLAPKSQVLPHWPRRGLDEIPSAVGDIMWTAEMAKCVVRCDPRPDDNGQESEDRTNGFFVACFLKQSNAKRKNSEFHSDIASKVLRLSDSQLERKRLRNREKKKRQKEKARIVQKAM